jgi:hypothetical protein
MRLLGVKGLFIPALVAFLLLFLQSGSPLQSQTTVPGTVPTATAPKWLATPTLDGKCDDPEYAQAGMVTLVASAGEIGTQVKLQHSGLELYVCFDGMNHAGNQRVVVRVESDHSRSVQTHPGAYAFSVSDTGAIDTSAGSPTGEWAPLQVPPKDLAAAVAVATSSNIWSAELRISLEWLGGYARTDSFSLAIEGTDGTTFQTWPGAAQASAPDSWGDLVLAPLYPDSVSAGSVFLDGRESYLVVPYSPDLNPSEITIEAWVKVVGGSCGTLIGNGRNESYWLALCQVIQFGHDGRNPILAGQTPLGDGWHHVAVIMNSKGRQTLYLDGEGDVDAGWEPAHEETQAEKDRVPEKLGVSDLMLRIGSDRDAPSGLDHLHGYLSELRIWNRVRTAQEIHDAAFQRLIGNEPGLVGLWPFTNGLQDVVGHHDAGLIADASLAREARDVTEFPQRPAPPPYTPPVPEPRPPWDAHIPFVLGPITIDGICNLSEYPGQSSVILEPDRNSSMHLVVTRDGLYLCTNVLWGGSGLESSVTLWIDRSGHGGAAPSSADLRIQLTPDGSLTAATGDGSGYGGPAPQGLDHQTLQGPELAPQEDVKPIHSPWWSSEVRIPLEVLAPFVPGQTLRFALLYKGTLAAGAQPGIAKNEAITGQWPAQFDLQKPDTWGVATTEQPMNSAETRAAGTAGMVNGVTVAGGMIVITPELQKSLKTERAKANNWFKKPNVWPRGAPTEGEYHTTCNAPALNFDDSDTKWPHVDKNFPTVRAEGTFTEINISDTDYAGIHDSHDLDMRMNLREEDRWLSLDGTGNQVLETESRPFDERALPLEGDHVTVVGRWIYDCSHEPKTEIHPIPIFESDRLESIPKGIGFPGSMTDVRVARIWMNSEPGGEFTYQFVGKGGAPCGACSPVEELVGAEEGSSQSHGPFSFSMELPLHNGDVGYQLPFIRVVEGPAGNVALTGLSDTQADITITPPASTGAYYWELILGYLDDPNPPSAKGKLYTVTLDQIEVVDSRDTLSAHWTFFVAFNNEWQKVWDDTYVDKGVYDIKRQFDVVAGDHPWEDRLHLRVIGFEGHPGGDWVGAGHDISPGGWNIGNNGPSGDPLPGLCCGQLTWQIGPWKLYFTVHDYYGGPTALPWQDSLFWLLRLLNEPDDPNRTDLGTLPVSEGGPTVTQHNSFLTKWPMQKDGVYVLANDIDRYQFALEDFADVSVAIQDAPNSVQVQQDQTFPYDEYAYEGDDCPTKDLGYKSAWYSVFSNDTNITDQPYTLQITTKWKTLPDDWGVKYDPPLPNPKVKGPIQGPIQATGRLVDLVTPEPGAEVTNDPGGLLPQHRSARKPCAWPSTPDYVATYDIYIPPVKTRPPGQRCQYDEDGSLVLTGGKTNLSVPDVNVEGYYSIILSDLNTQFPTHHVYVKVKSSTGHRVFYHLSAEWTDAAYYDPKSCKEIGELFDLAQRASGLLPVDYRPIGPDPGPLHVEVSQFGTYQLVQPAADGTFDTIISSFRNEPVLARLYDLSGVLLGEGTPLGAESISLTVPDGQIPQSHLSVTGLSTCNAIPQVSSAPGSCSVSQFYLLQLVPLFDVGSGGHQSITIGLTRPQPQGVAPPSRPLSRYRWEQEFQQGQLIVKQELLRTLQVQFQSLGVPLQPGTRSFAEVKDFQPEMGFTAGLPAGLQFDLATGSLSGLILAKPGEKYQALFQALNAQGAPAAELLIQSTITERALPPGQPHANPGGPYTAKCTQSAFSRDCDARVTLDGSSSLAATGHKLVRYQWDFGDSQSGEGVTVTHLYTVGPTESEHQFTACLTVTDDLNQQDKACTLVTITR